MFRTSKLEPLSVGKTVVFYLPFEKQDQEETYVRTGVQFSDFLNACLHSHSTTFARAGPERRAELRKDFSYSIRQNLVKIYWESNDDTFGTMLHFNRLYNEMLDDFYQYIKNDKKAATSKGKLFLRKILSDEKSITAYQILADLVSKSTFDIERTSDNIDRLIAEKTEKILEVGQNQLKTLKKHATAEKIQFLAKKFDEMVKTLFEIIRDDIYQSFEQKVLDDELIVDTDALDVIGRKIDRNIYVIDSRTRLPVLSTSNRSRRKSLLLMKFGPTSFEPIGRLLPENKVQRVFESTDELIDKIHSYLFNPKYLLGKYPDLADIVDEQKDQDE